MRKIAVILTVVGILAVIALLLTMKPSSIAKNPEAITEINKIEDLSRSDFNSSPPIKLADLEKLKQLGEHDSTVSEYMDELEWMLEKNLSEHLLHTTGFLRIYLTTGENIPCVPHELWHIALMIRYNDTDHALEHADDLDKTYAAWEKSASKRATAYPAYYKGLNQTKVEIKDALERIERRDLSEETLVLLEKVGEEGVC